MALTRAGPYGTDPLEMMLSGFMPLMTAGGTSSARMMALDVAETDTEFKAKLDVPGVKKEDVTIEVDGEVVRVSVACAADKEEDTEEAGVTYHRVERSSSYAARSLRLPPSADLGAMKAKLEAGVLEVTIPKKAEAEAKKRIAVE